MIGIMIIGILIVCTIVMYIANKKINEYRKGIKELENRLEEYYIKREERIKEVMDKYTSVVNTSELKN